VQWPANNHEIIINEKVTRRERKGINMKKKEKEEYNKIMIRKDRETS